MVLFFEQQQQKYLYCKDLGLALSSVTFFIRHTFVVHCKYEYQRAFFIVCVFTLSSTSATTMDLRIVNLDTP